MEEVGKVLFCCLGCLNLVLLLIYTVCWCQSSKASMLKCMSEIGHFAILVICALFLVAGVILLLGYKMDVELSDMLVVLSYGYLGSCLPKQADDKLNSDFLGHYEIYKIKSYDFEKGLLTGTICVRGTKFDFQAQAKQPEQDPEKFRVIRFVDGVAYGVAVE